MAQIQNLVVAHIDPINPVAEVCTVITAVVGYHPGKEEDILLGLQAAINKRIDQLRGAEISDKSIL